MMFRFLINTRYCQKRQSLRTMSTTTTTSTKSIHLNNLAKEKSPYLLQHKHNPVNWYPWGDEAIERAKAEEKPIFLSVGYSTCHWCHVMERESFENESISKILNEYFVSVKVDREERPDVDRVYMTYLQATQGGGGWPMSIWLTPELKPFYAGTYFPPNQSFGRIGFGDLLLRIHELWQNQREELIRSSREAIDALSNEEYSKMENKDIENESYFLNKVFTTYDSILKNTFDKTLGGFSSAPKFPRPVIFTALFHLFLRSSGDAKRDCLHMAGFTLAQMFKGGIHDHVGGGFHRYSVDKWWHVPHFEKMLYDQAQLAVSYLDMYNITKDPLYEKGTKDILKYVSTTLTSKSSSSSAVGSDTTVYGGFYSAEDADSQENHDSKHKTEGAFYVWKKLEIDSILKENSDLFCYHFGVTENGNAPPGSDPHGEFKWKNILIQRHDIVETSQKFNKTQEEAEKIIIKSLERLRVERDKRPRPFLDDKIITSWNGLMISAFAIASNVFPEEDYLLHAQNAANFILHYLYSDGYLIRNYREGPSTVKGFADDYAFMIAAFIDLYQADCDIKWLTLAYNLQNKMNELFYDEESGGFFSTTKDDQSIVMQSKEDYDGSEPSAVSYITITTEPKLR
eukprot:TRINITY_DN3390_c0_g1_i1.p1 TRINITY_DN3390_c0_g1~~TRINITY_DN3390_c0_g1_i1.p1  ORF type:complete len:626 (-),score=115.67 TRINITY_DN3390_c0_g1_i1:550-2427(-)